MTKADRVALACAAALGVVCLAGRATGQELSAEAKDKAATEARAKRNALAFEDNATTIVFYDRAGKRTGGLGERALYGETVVSPDGSRVAVVKNDLPSETADLFIVDIATGTSTRLTTSARTEFVMAPVWSPDSSRIAYVTIRKGQEAIYVRPANGQGSEELLYKNPGAFMNLSDWSLDGRLLTFAVSDLSGGTLFTLPLDGGADRKPTEVFKTDLRVFGPKFSPDGRFLSYIQIDKANRGEVFVRPVDPKTAGGPWQISDGSFSPAFGLGAMLAKGSRLDFIGGDFAMPQPAVKQSMYCQIGIPANRRREMAIGRERQCIMFLGQGTVHSLFEAAQQCVMNGWGVRFAGRFLQHLLQSMAINGPIDLVAQNAGKFGKCFELCRLRRRMDAA